MKFQSLVISCLISLFTVTFANPIQHAESGIPDSKDLITIQPHTRSAAVNAKHAAECAERGGVDVTDDSVQQVGHGVTDSVLCKITDKTKYAKYQSIHHPNDPLKQTCGNFGYTLCAHSYTVHAYRYPFNLSSNFTVTTLNNGIVTHILHDICNSNKTDGWFCKNDNTIENGCIVGSVLSVDKLRTENYELVSSCNNPIALYHDTDFDWKVNYLHSRISDSPYDRNII